MRSRCRVSVARYAGVLDCFAHGGARETRDGHVEEVTNSRRCQIHLQVLFSSSSPRITKASRSCASFLAASIHSARVSMFPEGGRRNRKTRGKGRRNTDAWVSRDRFLREDPLWQRSKDQGGRKAGDDVRRASTSNEWMVRPEVDSRSFTGDLNEKKSRPHVYAACMRTESTRARESTPRVFLEAADDATSTRNGGERASHSRLGLLCSGVGPYLVPSGGPSVAPEPPLRRGG